jgi:hypothetical protein
MLTNAASVNASDRSKFTRRAGRFLGGVGIAAVVAGTAYLHTWALRHDMADVAYLVTGLGCLTLAGLAVLTTMLRRWAWTFALSSLCLAFVILLSMAAFFY